MEPRSYSAVPIDTNFLIASYQRTTGDVGLDPSLPIANVKAAIISGILLPTTALSIFSGRRVAPQSSCPIFRQI